MLDLENKNGKRMYKFSTGFMNSVCMTDNILTFIGLSKEIITTIISRNVLITFFQVSALWIGNDMFPPPEGAIANF